LLKELFSFKEGKIVDQSTKKGIRTKFLFRRNLPSSLKKKRRIKNKGGTSLPINKGGTSLPRNKGGASLFFLLKFFRVAAYF